MEKQYNIQEAAKVMGFSPAYVRALLRSGKLHSEKVPISEGSDVLRHNITDADIAEFLDTTTRRNRRSDGRNKFLFYATPTELHEVIRILKAAGRVTNAVAETIVAANIRMPEADDG